MLGDLPLDRISAVSAIVWAAVGLVACAVAWPLVGVPGLGSAATGAGAGILFPILTVVTVFVVTRRRDSTRYAAIAFFAFLGGFVIKVAVFLVALTLLVQLAEIHPGTLYGALTATAVASLVVDLIVVNGIRVPGDRGVQSGRR